MFDLNDAIAQWRGALTSQPGIQVTDLEELEDHLREQITDLQNVGLTEEEAFLVGSRRLGKPADLRTEFAIADPDNRRRFRLRWMLVGALALIFLWLGSGFLTGLGASAVYWAAGGPLLPVAGSGLMIGLTRLLLLVFGVVMIWKLLATDGSSRRLARLGVGSVLLAAFLLAFLVLVTRVGTSFVLGRAAAHGDLAHLGMANAWVNILLWLLLPALLLVGLWKLVRR